MGSYCSLDNYLHLLCIVPDVHFIQLVLATWFIRCAVCYL